MPGAAWTVKDANGNLASEWIRQDTNSPLRLSLLRLHIREVSDKISQGDDSTEGTGHTFGNVANYLQRLLEAEQREAARLDVQSGTRALFTRGRALRP